MGKAKNTDQLNPYPTIEQTQQAVLAARIEHSANAGSVYFLLSGHLLKIGFSKNVDGRLRSFGAGVQHESAVIWTMSGSIRLEKAIHRALRPFRNRSEWFWYCLAVREAVHALGMPRKPDPFEVKSRDGSRSEVNDNNDFLWCRVRSRTENRVFIVNRVTAEEEIENLEAFGYDVEVDPRGFIREAR